MIRDDRKVSGQEMDRNNSHTNNGTGFGNSSGSSSNLLETSQQLATFEAAIAQLQRMMESGGVGNNNQKGLSSAQQQEQIRVLLEKYEKIEQLVLVEQESIDEAIGVSESIQHELTEEYAMHSRLIAQGKLEIVRLSIANKEALLIQNVGQKTLQRKQVEAEGLVQSIMKLQKDCQALKVIIHDKQTEQLRLDTINQQTQQSILEFRRDQEEEKAGISAWKEQIEANEKYSKGYRKEQQDLQKKMENSKRGCTEIRSKTQQHRNQLEVVLVELRNEKRTLGGNEKKFEEISNGLARLSEEIENSNTHLEQIRLVNGQLKEKLFAVENSLFVAESNSPESQELREIENLLRSYSQILSEKQTILMEKQQEKNLLEEHLLQLNQFAQGYLNEQQEVEEVDEDEEGTNHTGQHDIHSQQQHAEVDLIDSRIIAASTQQQQQQQLQQHAQHTQQKHHIPKPLQSAYGMECIQSLYEQEQDSQGSPHLDSRIIKSATANATAANANTNNNHHHNYHPSNDSQQHQSHRQQQSIPVHEIFIPDTMSSSNHNANQQLEEEHRFRVQQQQQQQNSNRNMNNSGSSAGQQQQQQQQQQHNEGRYSRRDEYSQQGSLGDEHHHGNGLMHIAGNVPVSSPTQSDQLNVEKYSLPLNYESGSFGALRSLDPQDSNETAPQVMSPQLQAAVLHSQQQQQLYQQHQQQLLLQQQQYNQFHGNDSNAEQQQNNDSDAYASNAVNGYNSFGQGGEDEGYDQQEQLEQQQYEDERQDDEGMVRLLSQEGGVAAGSIDTQQLRSFLANHNNNDQGIPAMSEGEMTEDRPLAVAMNEQEFNVFAMSKSPSAMSSSSASGASQVDSKQRIAIKNAIPATFNYADVLEQAKQRFANNNNNNNN